MGTALLLITLLAFSVIFVLRIYFLTETSCYDDLAIETEDAIAEFESNIRSDRMMLRVIAGLIANKEDVDSIEVSGYLTTYDTNSLITQIGILLPGDELISTKGHKVSVKGRLSFEEESAEGEHISGIQPSSRNSGSPIVRNYVPIMKDGVCEGMLFGEAIPGNMAWLQIPMMIKRRDMSCLPKRRRFLSNMP